MTRTVRIVGDGLAGLMLAVHLKRSGRTVVVHGDGQSNTPPVSLVHLFAGRTFRRSPLEIQAFEAAVAHWKEEPLAAEFPVRRRVTAGDRLDRSVDNADLPPNLAPRRLGDDWVGYEPGFSIASQELGTRLLAELGSCYQPGRVRISEVPGPRILALGVDAAGYWPQWSWDQSGGRTVEARPEMAAECIRIGAGVHIAPRPGGQTVVVGGRSSPLEPERDDELERAHELSGQRHTLLEIWSGRRCAPLADHSPVLGWFDDETFAFSGFGSRASFWLPYCVALAGRALLGDQPIPEELQWQRMGPN